MFVTLSGLGLAAPDGRPLLSDLNLGFGRERTGLVGANGVGKTTLLRVIAGEAGPQTGTCTVSGRAGFLRQAFEPGPGETVADLFGATDALALIDRAEAGAARAEELFEVDWNLPARLASVLAQLDLAVAPDVKLCQLSGGQRTRAALAALLFAEPDLLLLDEPTNNLDRDGRRAVLDLLAGWRGGAVVVSHDRELLERMDAIVELTSLGAARYGGGWSAYRLRKDEALAAARHDLADAESQAAKIARNAQASVERQARRDRKGRAKAKRGDMPKILIGARKDRSQDTGGALARLADDRGAEAAQAAAAARARIEVLEPLAVALHSTGLPTGREVLSLESVTAGYDPAHPVIRDFSLRIAGPERVALTGPNGSGKTTLLALIAGGLAPWSGTVRRPVATALLDQQAALLDPFLSVRDNFRRLNPTVSENAARAALARFMFRGDAALRLVSELSGGQTLRAGLACVLGAEPPPSLLILDEPTNHLDLRSIEAMEAGLRDYDGALVVVSHDEAFLQAIGVTRRLEAPFG